MAKKINEEKIPRLRVPTFAKFYATNVHCGLTNQDIRIEFMNEKMNEGKKWIMLVDSLVILTPTGAKRLFLKLKEIIDTYEGKNGKISIELEDKGY